MDDKITTEIVAFIKRAWLRFNLDGSSEGIWLAFHEPVKSIDHLPESNLHECLFITKEKVLEKSSSDYKVFMQHGLVLENIYRIAYSFAADYNGKLYIGYQLGARTDCLKNADFGLDQGATSLEPGAYYPYVRTRGVGATQRLTKRCFFKQSGYGAGYLCDIIDDRLTNFQQLWVS